MDQEEMYVSSNMKCDKPSSLIETIMVSGRQTVSTILKIQIDNMTSHICRGYLLGLGD